jgi:hypothetical protein
MNIVKQHSKEINVYKNLWVNYTYVWYLKWLNEMYSPSLELTTGPKQRLFFVHYISETFPRLHRFIPAKSDLIRTGIIEVSNRWDVLQCFEKLLIPVNRLLIAP